MCNEMNNSFHTNILYINYYANANQRCATRCFSSIKRAKIIFRLRNTNKILYKINKLRITIPYKTKIY